MSFIHSNNDYKYISEMNGRKIIHIKPLGKISKEQAEKELQLFKQQLEIKPIYRTIIIDPPWPIEKIYRDVAPNQIDMDYKTMSIDEIKSFPIKKFVSIEGCHLYIWTTQKYLPVSFDILRDWGFTYFFTMIWHKNGGFQPFGLPQYNAEFILFGSVGNLKFTTTKNFFCSFNADRTGHSKKPDEFYNMVRRVSPEPRIDIFSRSNHAGFDGYGYECNITKQP